MASARLPKIQHITITFPPGGEARLREFYSEVLGLREKPIPEVVRPLGWIWFETADESVELHCVPDEEPVPADTAHHFCIDVDDLGAWRKRISAAGHLVREARPLPYRPRFFTRDPFNNLIEVVHVEGDYLKN